MRNFLLIGILGGLLTACSPKEPKPANLIPREKMELILRDMIQADILAGDIMKRNPAIHDTAENLKMQLKIFEHYKITRKDYQQSYEYYCAHPETLQIMLDSIQVRFEKPEPIKDTNKRLKNYEKGI